MKTKKIKLRLSELSKKTGLKYRTKDMICKYSFKQLPEEFRNYAEKYIQEIENNIKSLKKKGEKVREVYNFKTGTLLGNSKLKEIVDIKPISELIYR